MQVAYLSPLTIDSMAIEMIGQIKATAALQVTLVFMAGFFGQFEKNSSLEN